MLQPPVAQDLLQETVVCRVAELESSWAVWLQQPLACSVVAQPLNTVWWDTAPVLSRNTLCRVTQAWWVVSSHVVEAGGLL